MVAVRRRRVLLLLPHLGRAGAENALVNLAVGLAERGHEVTVGTMVGHGRDPAPLLAAGIRLVDLGARQRVGKLLVMPRLVRLARSADLVHCGLWDMTLWGRLAAMLARRPVTVAEQTPGREFEVASGGGRRARWVSLHHRLLAPFTYAVGACGRWQVDLLEDEGVSRKKILHIPNGVPIDELRTPRAGEVTRASLAIPDDARVVIHVARFEPQKNQRATIDAVAALRAGLGDVCALLVGDGGERAELERYAHRIGADWALFLGVRSDVPALLRLADLAVLPSFGEGLPVALVEGIAAGVPTVATDVGDVRWVLETTEAGLCVPPSDQTAFEAACRAVLADAALHRRLADRARASRHFEASTMVDRYEKLFDAAIEGRPPLSCRDVGAAERPHPHEWSTAARSQWRAELSRLGQRARGAGRAVRAVTTEAGTGYDALAGRGNYFTHQSHGRHIDPDGLRGYYCDFRHKALAAMRDGADGFPLRSSGEPWDLVIPIAQAALGYWELRIEGHDTGRRFLLLADWLVDHAEVGPAGLAWYSNLALPKYQLEPGWPSAMGQSEAMSVLLRAHEMTGDERYLQTARAALDVMTTEVSEGGVSRRIDGHLVFEEYATALPLAILNGWIFALFGLHELAQTTCDERARAMFRASRAGLLALLPRYDIGWWSLYSLYDHGRPDLAKPFYQRLHPVLLDGLNVVAPDYRLTIFARRWEAQLTPLALARNAADKVSFRLWRELQENGTVMPAAG